MTPRHKPPLARLNPLTLFAATIPPMLALLFVRNVETPLAMLALAYIVIIGGVRLSWRVLLLLFAAIPLACAVVTLGFSLWIDPALVADTPVIVQVYGWMLHLGAIQTAAGTALRLAAILALAMISGLGTEGSRLVRASIQHLRVPYRVGYTALAAYRFVPRFRSELGVIRAAHRVRGYHGGRGPVASVRRGLGYLIPLLASGIRHAERVALSMDSRAFGAHPTRTERSSEPFGWADAIFTAVFWVACAVVFVLT